MKRILIAIMTASIAFASCTGKIDLNGDWKIVAVGTEEVEVSEAPPTLSFNSETGRIHGYTGVNIINGDYSHDGRKLTIGGVGATMMAGPEDDMIRERKILDAFNQVSRTKISEDGALLLVNSDDEALLTLERK